MRLTLDLNTIDGYRTFLRVKSLPVYRFTGREAWFPDEYAGAVGLIAADSRAAAYSPLPGLFDYQRDIAALAVRKRKFAVFADCGLGKTLNNRKLYPGVPVRPDDADGEGDTKHICPLQLGVIDRSVRLYTNPGEIVFSPFAGVGSEGYVALRRGRRFYGVELKEEYHRAALLNLARAAEKATDTAEPSLFAEASDV